MIISYQSRELRDDQLDGFLNFSKFSEDSKSMLNFVLTALASGNTLQDVPLKEQFYFNNDTLEIPLSDGIVAHFTIANEPYSVTTTNYDWGMVSRLKLKYIGESRNGK